MKDGMYWIDFHNHIGWMTQTRWGLYGQTPEQLISRMDRNGIDHAVVFPRSCPLNTEEFRKINDYVIEAVQRYPDRLTGFCFATPMHVNFHLEEIERCARAGLKGIKVHPVLHGFYPVDGPMMDPLMEKAEELSLPVLTHSDFNLPVCSPYQVANLAKRFPRVTVVMAHYGIDMFSCHMITEIAEGIDNLILDTAGTPDSPQAIYSEPAAEFPERIVFGSDGPSISVEVNLRKLEVAAELFGLTEESKRMILGTNAARILGLRLPVD